MDLEYGVFSQRRVSQKLTLKRGRDGVRKLKGINARDDQMLKKICGLARRKEKNWGGEVLSGETQTGVRKLRTHTRLPRNWKRNGLLSVQRRSFGKSPTTREIK